MRVLVTGVSGFVGRHLAARLTAAGDEVLGVVRPGGEVPPGVRKVEFDLATRGSELPSAEAVVHLAQANVGVERAGDLYAVSAGATLGLAQHAVACGAVSLVVASSGAVYGMGPEPMAESAPLLGDSMYAVAKIHSERFAHLYEERLSVSILRLFFPYGPGLPATRMIADVFRRVRDGVPVSLNEDGRPRVNPVHVSDVVEAIDRCIRVEASGALNVAGPDVVTVRQLADAAGVAVGRQASFEDSGRVADDLIADISRFRTFLGRDPLSLADGLATMTGPA